jgi:hypothetical protein
MKLITCLVVMLVSVSVSKLWAVDKSYNYNVPLKPLVNYTSSGRAYIFKPDPHYAYLMYPLGAAGFYGHYYSTTKYNTSKVKSVGTSD